MIHVTLDEHHTSQQLAVLLHEIIQTFVDTISFSSPSLSHSFARIIRFRFIFHHFLKVFVSRKCLKIFNQFEIIMIKIILFLFFPWIKKTTCQWSDPARFFRGLLGKQLSAKPKNQAISGIIISKFMISKFNLFSYFEVLPHSTT